MINLPTIFYKIPAPVFHGSILASQSFHRHTIGELLRSILISIGLSIIFSTTQAQQIIIQFHHIANGKPLVLADSSYTNPFGEKYQITRLKYYISNIGFAPQQQSNIALIDAAANDSIVIHAKAGNYQALYFTLGVDSALNCSGAQDGALDPTNGMFWTWNSGYIFFKMEGYSPASTADLQRIEHHIGGYRFPYNAAKNVALKFKQPLQLMPGDKKEIHVVLNLDRYWSGWNDVKIASLPLLMKPDKFSLMAAFNF